MKKFLFCIFIALIPFLVEAENYFKEGMVWKTESGIPLKKIKYYEIEKEVEKIGGFEVLGMYEVRDDDYAGRQLRCYIRTDGDKVYALNDTDASIWYLIYDFGLKPGEICKIYSLPYLKEEPRSSYVEIKEIRHSDSTPLEVMVLTEYFHEPGSEPSDIDVIWIKGVGSIKGPASNHFFGYDGHMSQLEEAAYNGEVLYRREMTKAFVSDEEKNSMHLDGLRLKIWNSGDAAYVKVCSADGLPARGQCTAEGGIIFDLPQEGMYVVSTGNGSTKILARQ